MKLLITLFALISASASFADYSNDLPALCRIKCADELFSKYMNGTADNKDIRYIKHVENVFFLKTAEELKPGRYEMDDARFDKTGVHHSFYCGIYANTLNDTQDYFEVMIPDSVHSNFGVKNGAPVVKGAYIITNKGLGNIHNSIFSKKPIFYSYDDVREGAKKELKELKISGICK